MDRTAYRKLLVEAFDRHYSEGSDVWSGDRQSEETTRLAAQVALRQTGRPKLAVLDIGCGNGRHLRELEAHASRYAGVDLYAHEDWEGIVKNAQVPVQFIQQDFLTWADAEAGDPYDLIIDCGCFHHQHPDDQGVYLEAAARQLQPDGLFSAVVWGEPFREGNVDDYGRYHFYFTPESVSRKFAAHGLEVVEVIESTALIGKRQLQVFARRFT